MRHSRFDLAACLAAVLLTCNVHPSAWSTDVVTYRPGEVVQAHRWDVMDIRFSVQDLPESPTDIEFTATFLSDDQSLQQTAAGFYDGDREWVIRFTPPSEGRWDFVTSSTLTGLDGKRGQVHVQPARPTRRGGIIIDRQHPTRFQYANGEQYYPIAFEADWLFALDAENTKGIPRTRQLVDTLAENGFNQIVMNVYAYDVNWPKDPHLDPRHDFSRPSVFPFGGSNEQPDYSKLSIGFFQHLDRVIEYLDKKGIVAHLMVYVWNKRVQWPPADSDADNRYFDYVVNRYQAYPNLIWDVSKEALGYGHNDANYITDRIERLRQRDKFDRLITVHDYGYCRRFPDQVDFVSVQLWSSELYHVMRDVCKSFPGRPILNIEHGGYERSPYVIFTGNYTAPETCLMRAWKCVFAGTYPTHYWQGAAWNVIIPDITSLPPSQRPRLEYYRHMRSFIQRYDVGNLIAGDKRSNAGFCLHNGDDLFLYFVPRECEFIGIRLPPEHRDKTMIGTWFTPFDGTYSNPESKPIVQWPAFAKPPGDGFRILVIQIQPSE